MLSISSLVAAGTALLGLAEQPPPLPTPSRPKDSLASILQRRLVQFQGHDWTAHTLPASLAVVIAHPTPSEGDLKRATAESAAFLLTLINSLADEETLSQPSTSTAKLVHIPLFGSRDVKVIATLAGVLGRWGISARIIDGILPSSLKEGQKPINKTTSRFSEIVDIPASNDVEELKIVAKQVLNLVQLPAGERRDSGRGQLAALVLPQLLLPLLGALVQIGFSSTTEIWARESLDTLFRSCVIPHSYTVTTLTAFCRQEYSSNDSGLAPHAPLRRFTLAPVAPPVAVKSTLGTAHATRRSASAVGRRSRERGRCRAEQIGDDGQIIRLEAGWTE